MDAKLDRFTQRALPDVHARYSAGRGTLERLAYFARLGFLVQFNDHDLGVLYRAGYLSRADIRALATAERGPQKEGE